MTTWRDWAACRDHPDPELFFPVHGSDGRAAKAVCAGCPVTSPCLTFALEHDLRDGVWGGTSENQRAGMRRLRRYRTARQHERGATAQEVEVLHRGGRTYTTAAGQVGVSARTVSRWRAGTGGR